MDAGEHAPFGSGMAHDKLQLTVGARRATGTCPASPPSDPQMERGALDALQNMAMDADEVQPVQVLLIGELAPTQIRAISVR